MDINRRLLHLTLLLLCGSLCISLNAADSYYDEQEETDNSTTLDDGDYDDAADNTTMFDESDLDMQDEEPPGPGPIISVETGDQDSTDTVQKPNEPNFVAELDEPTLFMECPAACECAHSDTKSINCSRRGLTHIPRLPATVDHLDLSHNELVDIPSDSFENATLLRLLDMSHNRIAQIEQDAFANTNQLQHLNLSHNQLDELDANIFAASPSLTHLSLAYNPIVLHSDRAFLNLTKLQQLNLQGCNLSNVYDNTFEHLTGLTDLNLRNNSLGENLNADAFQRLDKLAKLQLAAMPLGDINRLCTMLPFIDVIHSDSLNISCYMLAAGLSFEESTITRAPPKKVEVTTRKTIQLTTNSTPLPTKPTSIIYPSTTESNRRPIPTVAANDTQPNADYKDTTSVQSPQNKVQVSSHTLRHVLIGSIVVAIVGLAIGLCCRRDVFGVKTKLCRKSHRAPSATDRVQPAEQVPLKDIELKEINKMREVV